MSLILPLQDRVSWPVAAAALACGLAGAAVVAAPALAAQAPVVSQPVVQALPNAATQRLNTALGRLGRNPRDVAALLDAGEAARALGDFEAALGFYRRADEASPSDPRIKAGLAGIYVMRGDPVSAIPYFDAAERAGASPSAIGADRGLAYDLVGDNASAQRYYAPALTGANGDEVRQRLAVSQAIAGDQKSAYATLLPLLSKQDKPAWRTHAFTLAIGGDTVQAIEVAGKILPPPLAQNIAPYLRYMPRLTKAQQAAAADLGRFPRASEIGRDDPRIAAYAPKFAAADANLIPKGEPLDGGTRKSRKSTSRTRLAKAEQEDAAKAARQAPVQLASTVSAANPDRVLPPDPKPAIENSGELPPLAHKEAMAPVGLGPSTEPRVESPAAAASRPSVARSANVVPEPAATTIPAGAAPASPAQVAVSTPVPARSETPAPVRPALASAPPGFDLAKVPGERPPAAPAPASSQPASSPPAPSQPAITLPPTASEPAKAEASPAPAPAAAGPAATPAAAPAPEPAAPGFSLAEIFADIGRPTGQAVPVSGAVDIRKIAPAKPQPKAEPKPVEPPKPKKPPPPSHPSRIWVQIGVGRDKDAIAFDWRRHLRETPALFKGRTPYISDMGRTNRILIGPIETQKAANALVADLRKAGVDGALPWTSPAGQVVDPLSVK